MQFQCTARFDRVHIDLLRRHLTLHDLDNCRVSHKCDGCQLVCPDRFRWRTAAIRAWLLPPDTFRFGKFVLSPMDIMNFNVELLYPDGKVG